MVCFSKTNTYIQLGFKKTTGTAPSLLWGYEVKEVIPSLESLVVLPSLQCVKLLPSLADQGSAFPAELLSSQFLPFPPTSGPAEVANTAGPKMKIITLRTQVLLQIE